MSLSHLLLTASAALMFGIATFSAQGQTASGPSSGRVFELRTYHCAPGKLEDLKARFRNHTTKIFERHGIQNIGYWTFQDEPEKANTLIYMIAHASREQAKKNWAEFSADPEWQKVRAESEANGKIVEKVDSVFLDPTDFSPIQ